MSTIDIESLIKPINKKQPTGHDLRDDTSIESLYFKAKDARNNARNIERLATQSEDGGDAAKEWEMVYQTSLDILTNKSKDLEVCAWLTEALLRKQGFSGLHQGFELIKQLIEKYWERLYPLPDEDGLETRIAALAGLNGINSEGSLIAPIAQQHITQGSSIGPFALWQYQFALELPKINDEKQRQKKINQVGFSLEDIQTAVKESSVDFYQDLKQQLTDCLASFKELHLLLDKKCGKDAPPYSYINSALENFQDHMTYILQDAPFSINEASIDVDTPEHVKNEKQVLASTQVIQKTHHSSNKGITLSVNDRDDALNALNKIADFFAKTEPHSPLSYVIHRTAHWGNLPLPELLEEIIQDDNVRQNVCRLTGIKNIIKKPT